VNRRHRPEGASRWHIVSVAVIIAVGVNADGRREILGMEIGTSEAEPICTEFLRRMGRPARQIYDTSVMGPLVSITNSQLRHPRNLWPFAEREARAAVGDIRHRSDARVRKSGDSFISGVIGNRVPVGTSSACFHRAETSILLA
jgi:hypothetical protein